ncbi:hypothetical protein EDM68_03405 [Candidatus Uhrbacteria bacterium]|nr:MAG: hypothetical protein EDM68_03405 [Candidatus Uhrbacteria bacterium]
MTEPIDTKSNGGSSEAEAELLKARAEAKAAELRAVAAEQAIERLRGIETVVERTYLRLAETVDRAVKAVHKLVWPSAWVFLVACALIGVYSFTQGWRLGAVRDEVNKQKEEIGGRLIDIQESTMKAISANVEVEKGFLRAKEDQAVVLSKLVGLQGSVAGMETLVAEVTGETTSTIGKAKSLISQVDIKAREVSGLITTLDAAKTEVAASKADADKEVARLKEVTLVFAEYLFCDKKSDGFQMLDEQGRNIGEHNANVLLAKLNRVLFREGEETERDEFNKKVIAQCP